MSQRQGYSLRPRGVTWRDTGSSSYTAVSVFVVKIKYKCAVDFALSTDMETGYGVPTKVL